MRSKLTSIISITIWIFFFIDSKGQTWSGTTPGTIYYNSGNVGIGTSNPTSNFQVTGNSGYDAATILRITNGAADYGRTTLILTGRLQTGNDFWSFGSNGRNSIVFSTNTTTGSGQKIGDVGTEQFAIQHEQQSNCLGFLSSTKGNVPLFMMTQSGSIGIGTATPDAKLHIKSTLGEKGIYVSANDSWIAYSDGKNYFRGTTVFAETNSADKVGIGTASPDEKLVVNGNFRMGVPTAKLYWDWSSRCIEQFSPDNGTSQLIRFKNSMTTLAGNPLGGFDFADHNGISVLRINNNKVGIGTSSPDESLTVKGKIHTQEVRVDLDGAVAPDYVFAPDYDLMTLEELRAYIKDNSHLPDVPSAEQMEREGIELKEMNLSLLRKVEELTLHVLALSAEVEELKRK